MPSSESVLSALSLEANETGAVSFNDSLLHLRNGCNPLEDEASFETVVRAVADACRLPSHMH